MNDWTEIRVKDRFDVYTGATPSSKDAKNWDGDICWVTPADMQDFGIIYDGKTHITETGYNSCGTHLVPAGSIILSSRAPIGKVNIAGRTMCTNQGCKSLVPHKVNAKFVAYQLYNQKEFLDILGQGTTFKEFPLKKVVSLQLTLPDLTTQHRIVSYLDSKTAAIDERIELLSKKRDAYLRLKKSLINKTVTKGLNPNVKMKDSGIEWIGEIPEHWETRRGKDLGEIIHGISFTPDDICEPQEGVLVLRAGNIQDSSIVFTDNIYVKNNKVPKTKTIKKNDIVICSTNGSLSLVGKSAIAHEDLQASFGSFMLRFRTNQNSRFIQYQLSQYVDMYRGLFATTTINQLTISQLGSMKFYIPNISEQLKIADYLDSKCSEIDSNIENIDKQTEALKRLKKSLINEVITGYRAV